MVIRMFEVNSTPERQTSDHKLPSSPKKATRKPKAHSFAALISILQDWKPRDPLALRRQLINEAIMMLNEKNFNCARACIPAIVVDKQYPVDLLHYQSDKDIDEFITRMLWMHQEFNCVIGILLGVPDEETAAKVEEAYQSLMMSDEDCVVLLM